ncbi:MAG TPA: hypothetical protein VKR83_06235 [Ktedonobacteraceae bacterium]|nr:hypothetical protein [Ktedonobacteraceae bacterium]
MEQFALASVYSRSIAWLIRLDEWERFEEIIKYNCAMVGGYFNVFIPLAEEDTLSEQYQRFLIDYDPDLIVMAPDQKPESLDTLHSYLHSFAVIPWVSISEVAELDPWSGGSGINATLGADVAFNSSQSFVAVADDKYPDTSRLALVACGDVEPREPMWHKMDEVVSLNATGYREMFLMRLLKSEFDERHLDLVGTHLDEEGNIIAAPDRYKLSDIVKEEHTFPLVSRTERLETCCTLQHHTRTSQSFIGLTGPYKRSGTPLRKQRRRETSGLVILISDNFGLEEGILFWNLRASGFFVSWLSFAEIKSDTDELIKWLESDYGGGFYSLVSGGLDIVFSSRDDSLANLEVFFENLLRKRQGEFPNWHIVTYDEIVFYDYIRPYIRQERVSIVESAGKYIFIPKLPLSSTGIYIVTLEWDGLMLPPDSTIVSSLVSSEIVKGFLPHFRNGRRVTEEPVILPRFRFTIGRYLAAQISSEEPVTFKKPSSEKVIEKLFTAAGFSRIELSSTARYHRIFLERIGELEKIQQYMVASPYRELLDLLSDNSDKRKTGWILPKPSERRALNHLQLWSALGKAIPLETKAYFDTISDILPEEALDLLERGILERGFVLRCTTCSYHSWYPVEHVGQTFECIRCLQTQIYRSNPLWLYKLPEVIFQGFNDNMQIPFLALYYLKHKSQHCFEWVSDSDVYWVDNGNEIHKNVDILCLCDGKFYIGEAKSNDEIDRDQFSFYEDICRRVAIDGIVFATSKPQWKRATVQRIEQLKTQFDGEVLMLTEHDLYLGNAAS